MRIKIIFTCYSYTFLGNKSLYFPTIYAINCYHIKQYQMIQTTSVLIVNQFLLISIPKIDCLPGYYFPGCYLPCRYPNYGHDCQSECLSCTKQNCNHITGCPEKSNVYLILTKTLSIQYQYSFWLSICLSVCWPVCSFPRFY